MATTLQPDYRPSDDEPFMSPRQLDYFRRKLLLWREEILRESQETLQHLQEDTVAEPDLADRASTESERALELRLQLLVLRRLRQCFADFFWCCWSSK